MTLKDKLLEWLNLALMIDLFVVLGGFFWFAIAVIGRSLDMPLGLDLWYTLWQPVFNPAIGILILGAIVSGVASWLNKRLADRQQSGEGS
jgi:uncharacterized membrane protein (DUF106 family)